MNKSERIPMSHQWQQAGGEWSCGNARAARNAHNEFVITTFGPDASADEAFAAIRAAMPMGAIRLRITDATRAVIDQLIADRRIKGAKPAPEGIEEFGIVAIKTR